MMGIIGGALAGAGAQMVDLADKSITQDHALERERVSSDLAVQRAQALELFKESRTNALRTQMVDRVNTAAGQIADDKLAPKLAQEEAGIVDRAAWTPEQQAAVDQSNQLDRSGIIARAKTDGSAAIATGDIDPKDAATLNNKSDALLYKTLYEQSKEDGRNARADARTQAMVDNADNRNAVMMRGQDKRLEAMLAHFQKTGAGNPTKEALAFLEGSRKEVASESQEVKGLYQSDLKNAKFPDERKAVEEKYKAKFDDITKRRRQVDADYNAMRARVGLPAVGSDAAPVPAPDPAAPPAPAASAASPAASAPAIPPNAKRVGTSGGKPVYQLPDGTQFIPK